MSNILLHDLNHLGLLIVEGTDRETYLQGQLTNDVREVSKGQSQLAGMCTPKGRMLANMRLVPGEERYFLLLAKELVEPVQKRLGMFILRSQVKLTPADESFNLLGLSGGGASSLLEDAPDAVDETLVARDGCTITRIAGESERFLLVGPADAIASRRAYLAAKTEVAGPGAWTLDDIRAGLPLIHEETVEAFVPQMTNMSLVNGVSFTKGCYTGQEVVARMQYLGKLKRRMYRVAIDGECPPPGTELFSASSASGQGAGKVVLSAPAGDGQCEALIVTEIANAEANDVHLGDADGPRLEFLTLPYAFLENE